MNRTIVGRITQARGARHMIETYIRQLTELGSYAPFAAIFLLYVFGKAYGDEQQKMREERVRPLKQERRMFERVEQQLVKEIGAKTGQRGLFRRLAPRRAR